MTKNRNFKLLFFVVNVFILASCNDTSSSKNEKPTSPAATTIQEQASETSNNSSLSDIELNKLYSHTQGDSPSPYFDNLVIASSKPDFESVQAFQLAQPYEDGNNGSNAPNLSLADYWFSFALKNDTSADNSYCSRFRQIMEADESAINNKAQQKLDIENNGMTETELKNITDWHKSNIKRYSKIISESCN